MLWKYYNIALLKHFYLLPALFNLTMDWMRHLIFSPLIMVAKFLSLSVITNVLKSGPDRTVQLEKPRPSHLYGLLNIRTVLCKKSSKPYEPRSDRPVLWIMTGSGGSHGSFVSSLKRHCFGLSSLFFFLYGIVWALELDHYLKQETLASLFQSRNPR